jgi:hypothetical protein
MQAPTEPVNKAQHKPVDMAAIADSQIRSAAQDIDLKRAILSTSLCNGRCCAGLIASGKKARRSQKPSHTPMPGNAMPGKTLKPENVST